VRGQDQTAQAPAADPRRTDELSGAEPELPLLPLLIVHRDELEANLAAYFAQSQPAVVGHDYLVVGTLDRPDWQKGVKGAVSVAEMFDHLHDFRQVLNFEVTGGWQPKETPGKGRPAGEP
jgi:hypothetical protein